MVHRRCAPLPTQSGFPLFINRFDGPRGQSLSSGRPEAGPVGRKQIRANTAMPRPPLPTLRTAIVAKSESTLAPAKINLTLRILGRRADGFHELESLVAFAPFGDRLTLWPDGSLDLKVSGPMAAGAGPLTDNLVLRVARALAERIEGLRLGRFALFKRLPSGAGLGGGSADAAAALRLIAEANGLGLDDRRIHEAARATGADIPVCLDPRPRVMRGIGEILSAPMVLPKLGILIVHPGLALPTGPVFKALGLAPGEQLAARSPPCSPPPCGEGSGVGVGGGGTAVLHGTTPHPSPPPQGGRETQAPNRDALLAWLASERNDLEKAAISIVPEIADVLSAIAGLAGCRLARMSGSGSACFGLFDSARATTAAAKRLAAARPSWWVRAGLLGS
jgi:4-diphosphocytidyl-2-C-methyl-D-erythritol kinase